MILRSKISVSWKQARMVECGFLKALTLRKNGDLSPNDLGESITSCDPVI